jgi:TolB-like protein/class 3 adenylate cyclase
MARKLAAILAADVAGFSRWMGKDEAGTLEALRASREVLVAQITAHQGRIFGGAGDSVIAEFASAVEATEAAIAIQRALANAPKATTPQLRFRIGLNLGDVIVEGDNLFGDGVNVAARIESLAEPGGIALSQAVYEQIRGKIDITAEALGPQRLKNIATPVEVYRIVLDGHSRPLPTRLMAAVRRPAVKLAAAMVLALLAGVLAWQAPRSLQTTSRKPVIAVLPFTTLGGDEATRRLADGLTEDILTDLSHFRGLEVVASSSSGTFNGKTVDAREIGKALGAPYLLTGTVQREGGQLRISAQLIAPSSGEHLWAQRWDRPAEDAFTIQSQLAEQVAATLGSIDSSAAITASEIGKAKGQAPEFAGLRLLPSFSRGAWPIHQGGPRVRDRRCRQGHRPRSRIRSSLCRPGTIGVQYDPPWGGLRDGHARHGGGRAEVGRACAR